MRYCRIFFNIFLVGILPDFPYPHRKITAPMNINATGNPYII